MKLGERGLVSVANKGLQSKAITLPSFASKVVDSTGTGDALLAYSTLSLIVTKSIIKASILGSVAAACACENDGNIEVKPEHIIEKLNSLQTESSYQIQK